MATRKSVAARKTVVKKPVKKPVKKTGSKTSVKASKKTSPAKASKRATSAKASKRATQGKKAPVTGSSTLYHALNDLWHTIRHISLLEETVCTLREEARQGHEPDATFLRDLRRTLSNLPVHDLTTTANELRAHTAPHRK